MGSLADHKLPTINFSEQNLEGGSSSWLSTSKEVVRGLEEHGCFVATFTNFSLKLHHAIFEASKQSFDLPTHAKMLNTPDTNPTMGYLGQVPIAPLYERLGIENATTEEGVQRFTDQLFPLGNDTFRETALEYSKVVAELEQVVMKMVSEIYGISNSYKSMLEKIWYHLRLIKYRPPKEDEPGLGILPHTDKSFMTILHQTQVNGLQIKTKDGDDWIAVDLSPAAFIVIAGDACTAWSNGRIEAPHHRVMMGGSEERYSLGLFSFIKDVEIKAPEEVVDEDHPLQFKPFDHFKFLHYFVTEEGMRSKCPIRDYCGV